MKALEAAIPTRSAHSGFSLLELMFAITVLAVLLSLAVPSFNEAARNNRVSTQTNDLVAALAMARSEAVRRGMPVAVCAANDVGQTQCIAADEQNWSANGYIVFTDRAGTAGLVDGSDEILNLLPRSPANVAVDSINPATGTGRGFIRFADTGLPTTPTTTISVRHSQCTGTNQRRIEILNTGRVATDRVAC